MLIANVNLLDCFLTFKAYPELKDLPEAKVKAFLEFMAVYPFDFYNSIEVRCLVSLKMFTAFT